VLGLEPADWETMNKGDWRKGLVAGMIRRRALVDNGWLAEHLHMGARNAVSRTVKQAQEHTRSNRQARQIAKEINECVK
jgi:hypothetical protein